MTQEQKKSFSTRLGFFQAFLFLFAALIVFRLFFVSISQHNMYKALADTQHGYSEVLEADRGQIYVSDKFGQSYPVATNTKKNLVYAVPKQVKNPDSAASLLAAVLGMPKEDVLAKISDTSRQYVAIAHYLSDDQSAQVTKGKLDGIFLTPENLRYYPEGNFLSQVLGYLGYKDNTDTKVGLYGLEKYFEKDLAGKQGSVATEADLGGNWITGSARNFTPAVDGTSMALTIDRSIQNAAQKALDDAVQKHGADSGTVIVENPKTGAILAMANSPAFDPNQYSKASSPSVYLNSATMENYEPGSTMKAVTLSAALDKGLITPQTTYNDTGVVDISGYKIKNSDGKGHGVVSMTDVIDHSLNTGAIYVEQQLGNPTFLDYLKKFGFGKATDVELQENIGSLSNLKGNIQVNYYTASFGQGVTVTPIQMIQAYQAMANGGKMMQPYIVESKITADGKTEKTQPKTIAQVISDKAASQMSGMLVDDVENGYGKSAGVKGYYIGGKTGTAQVASNGSYVQNDNIGSFVGYGPIENPQFVMLVNINHPRDVNFAESTAAPTFGQIAQFILNYYQIAPTRK